MIQPKKLITHLSNFDDLTHQWEVFSPYLTRITQIQYFEQIPQRNTRDDLFVT